MASDYFQAEIINKIQAMKFGPNISDISESHPELSLSKLNSTVILDIPENRFFFVQENGKWQSMLDEILRINGCKRFLINFENTFLLTSSMLSQLLWFREKLAQKQYKIALCALHPEAKEILHRTCLDQFFEIFDSVQEAFS
ncbi:MAG: STAS domain-containing protein [Planctomycetia bacterium]|nr:STAS domain-containing protein [Planctomycetia bacterium]